MEKIMENRYTIAKILGTIGTASGLLFLFVANKSTGNMTFAEILGVIWFFSTLATYVFGGFVKAIKMSFSIARWGWLLVPFFPADIVTGLMGMMLAICVFFFIPIVPVLLAERENR